MSLHATATFSVKAWDEKPYNEAPGELKLTRTSVTYAYQGDIEGESTLDYLMVYRDDGSGNFVGLERIVGRLGDRAGSFVLQHSGTFTKQTVQAAYFVVPLSGTGELTKLRGQGEMTLGGHAEHYPMALEYDLD